MSENIGSTFHGRLSAIFAGLDSVNVGRSGHTSQATCTNSWVTKATATVISPRTNLKQTGDGISCAPAFDREAIEFALGDGAPKPAQGTAVDEPAAECTSPDPYDHAEQQPCGITGVPTNFGDVDGDTEPFGDQKNRLGTAKPCYQFSQTATCQFGERCHFSHVVPGFARDPSRYTKIKLDWSDSAGDNRAAATTTFALLAAEKRLHSEGPRHEVGQKIAFVSRKNRSKRERGQTPTTDDSSVLVPVHEFSASPGTAVDANAAAPTQASDAAELEVEAQNGVSAKKPRKKAGSKNKHAELNCLASSMLDEHDDM